MIRIDRKKFTPTTSACIDQVRAGEPIVITEGKKPVAEIRPILESITSGRRFLGFAPGMAKILPSFFDPMTEEELKLWYGE